MATSITFAERAKLAVPLNSPSYKPVAKGSSKFGTKINTDKPNGGGLLTPPAGVGRVPLGKDAILNAQPQQISVPSVPVVTERIPAKYNEIDDKVLHGKNEQRASLITPNVVPPIPFVENTGYDTKKSVNVSAIGDATTSNFGKLNSVAGSKMKLPIVYAVDSGLINNNMSIPKTGIGNIPEPKVTTTPDVTSNTSQAGFSGIGLIILAGLAITFLFRK